MQDHINYEIAELQAAEALLERACTELSRAAMSQEREHPGVERVPARALWLHAREVSSATRWMRSRLEGKVMGAGR